MSHLRLWNMICFIGDVRWYASFSCPRVIFIRDLMELPSRVWSAETLELGMSLVEEGVGMDGLDDRSDAALQEQLRQLEDGWVDEKCKVWFFNDRSVCPECLILISFLQLCQELRASNLAHAMCSQPKPVPTPVRSLVASEAAGPDDDTQPADTLGALNADRVSWCGWNKGSGFKSKFVMH